MGYIANLDHVKNIFTATPGFCLYALIPLVIVLANKTNRSSRPRGCKKLGLPPSRSNLHDEYDPKYAQGVPSHHIDETGKQSWRIKALFTYPIKSCAGVELDVADVVSTGLAYDRLFCFAEHIPSADGSDGEEGRWQLKTLRDAHFAKLALVRPEIWVPNPVAPDYNPDLEEVKAGGVMVVFYPRVSDGICHLFSTLAVYLGLIPSEHSFRVPLSTPSDTYPTLPIKVWKDTPLAADYSQHLPMSFLNFLSPSPSSQTRSRISLFRTIPCHPRQIFRNAPRKEELGFQPTTAFADAYPIHLLNLASVRDVGDRCADQIPQLSIRRFRANIIIQGPGRFEEDDWKRIRLFPQGTPPEASSPTGVKEGVEIHTVCRTVRCRLPNVDPDTGIRHPREPDRTLKAYRRIDPGCEEFACLGMQLVPVVRSEYLIRLVYAGLIGSRLYG